MDTEILKGSSATNLVTLEVIGVNNTGDTRIDLDFVRIFPDGTVPPGPPWFRVPPNYLLIVTDADWQYNLGEPGRIQTFRIFIENIAEPSICSRVFESTITLNGNGEGGISESMTSGFAVSSKGRMTVDCMPGGGVISHIILRGYLIREH